MVKVSPEKNKDVINKVLTQHSLNDEHTVVSAYEQGELVGYVALKENGHTLDVSVFNVLACEDYTKPTANDKFLAELMIRSVANYGANRDMVYLTSEDNNLFFTSTLLGFNSSQDNVRIFIPGLLRKCSHSD